MKKLFIALLLLLTPTITLAQVTAKGGGTGTTTWQTNSIPYFGGFRFTENNAFLSFNGTTFATKYASTTQVSATSLCLTGDICRTTWPTAGAAWPFTPSTNFGVAVQSTSTPEWFTTGVQASSTSQFVDANFWDAIQVKGADGTATSTFIGDVRIGTVSGNDNMLRVQPARTYSSSVSVGGAFNLTNTSNDGAGMVLYTNHAASATGRLFSADCGNSLFDQNCVNIQSAGTQSALNISGGSPGLGIVKIAGLSGAPSNNSSAGLSVDSSANSFQGQGIFAKCNSATTTPCFVLRDASSNLMFSVDGNKLATLINSTTTNATITGSTWLTGQTNKTCLGTDSNGLVGAGTCTGTVTSITAGNGLNGGTITTSGTLSLKSYIATSSAETTSYVPFWASTNGTPANLSGGNSGFTFTNASTLLTITNASTTNLSVNSNEVSGERYIMPFLATTTTWTATSSATSAFGDKARGYFPFTGSIKSFWAATDAGTLELKVTCGSNSLYIAASTTANLNAASLSCTKGDLFTIVGGNPASSPTQVTMTFTATGF